MFTQCPHCLTLFRISSAQLKSAGGKVRCCQCNQVFNALDSLQENPLPMQITDEEDLLSENQDEEDLLRVTPPEDDGLFTETLNLDSDQLIELTRADDRAEVSLPDALDTSLLVEKDDGLEPEPDYFAAGSESQMSELLDRDTSSLIVHQDTDTAENDNVVPFNPSLEENSIPEEDSAPQEESLMPEESPAPGEEIIDSQLSSIRERPEEEQNTRSQEGESNYQINQMFEKQGISYRTVAWGLGSLLLISSLALQLTWHYRDQVVHITYGQQILAHICKLAGCNAPQRRDTSRIQIEHRDLRAHPEISNALLLQLGIANHAAFDQPFPDLQLSLFNDNEKLIAGRRFKPSEYLPTGLQHNGVMRRSQTISVALELLDPGKDVTGFKFDFL